MGVQGLIAAGVDPNTLHRHGAPSPLAYLRSLIAGDGHVEYSRGTSETPTWVTGEALMALEGKAAPDRARSARHTATAPPARPERCTTAATARAVGRRVVRPPLGASRRSRARARPGSRAPPPGASPDVDRLVVATGILTALSLAVARRELKPIQDETRYPPAPHMQIGVPKETAEGERRVALVPEVVRKLERR